MKKEHSVVPANSPGADVWARSDTPIAYGVLLIYAFLVLLLLPPRAYALMLSGAAVLIGGTVIAARLWEDRGTPAMTILFASFVGAAVLVVPNFPAMGGADPVAVPLGFLGSQGVTLLWLVLRWSPWPRRAERASLAKCLGFGVLGAVGLSAIATIPIVIGFLADPAEILPLLWVYPAYFTGITAAAVFYWLLQGISHRPVGRYLIGVLGGMCLYGAVGPVVSVIEREPIVLTELLTIATIAGVFVGPPVALGLMDGSPSAVELA